MYRYVGFKKKRENKNINKDLPLWSCFSILRENTLSAVPDGIKC